MSETTVAAGTGSKMKLVLFILIGLLSIGAGIGGTWYVMKNQYEGEESEITQIAKKRPTTFMKLDTFTVNLQSEDSESHYLQVELVIKANETEVVNVITRKMPEIRNQILLLLSSKKPSEISNLEGKQQLSQDIAKAVKSKIESEILQDDILDVLFTSFIIQ
jgi:flagellar FliL protein